MRTIDATLDSPIMLTKTDTNITTTVRFCVKPWLESYPGCVIELIHRRNQDAGGLPAAILETDGEYAYWLVTDADTAYAGYGEAELLMKSGDAKAKSPTYTTYVDRSVASDEETPPEPIERFVEQISDAAADAINAKNDAVSAKEDAESAKTAAETAKEDAETAARQAESASEHSPYIGENRHWYLWDAESETYVDTGITAEGKDGDDGISPEVTFEVIEGGHSMTVTDAEHPDGQTINILNGADAEVPIDDTEPAVNKVYSSAKVEEKVSSLNQAIAKVDRENAEQARILENLKIAATGKLFNYVDDTTAAWRKTLQIGVLPNGLLTKIGGKSIAWNQLCPILPNDTYTVGGVTITNNHDGSYTLNGTATITKRFAFIDTDPTGDLIIPSGHKYLISCNNSKMSSTWGYCCFTYMGTGVTGEHNHALDETPSSGFTNFSFRVISGVTYENDVIRPVWYNLTTMRIASDITTVDQFRAMFPNDYYPYSAPTLMSAPVTQIVNKNASNVVVQTKDIPSAVQALDGYGIEGNHISYDASTGKWSFTQNRKQIDGGNLTYKYSDDPYFIFSSESIIGIKPDSELIVQGYVHTGSTTTSTVLTSMENMTTKKWSALSSSTRFYIKNTAYTAPSDFKTAMTGVPIIYELATPVVTDITALMPEGYHILTGLEAGGTLTFVNTHGDDYRIPVPSTESYEVSVQEVLNNG